MRNQQAIKLFLVLIICTTYIFSFSHFGAFAYDSIMHKDDYFTDGTKIGSVNVADKSVQESEQLLTAEVLKWGEEASIEINYREVSLPLDLSLIQFDITSTFNQIQQGKQNSVVAHLDSLEDVLSNVSSSMNLSDYDLNKLKEDILASARMLELGSFQFRVEDYLLNEGTGNIKKIAEFSLELDEVPHELSKLVVNPIEILPQSKFSLLTYITEQGIEDIYTDSLSIMATGMYEVILPSNFSIIERHISNELPTYAKLGYEAKANLSKNFDLIFYNPNEFSYTIGFELKDNILNVALIGPELLNSYSTHTEDEQSFEPKTVIQYSPLLKPLETRVETEGKQGLLIKVYRESFDEKGALLKKELISEDFYPPIHRVEVHGLSGKEDQTTGGNNSGGSNTGDEGGISDGSEDSSGDNGSEQDSEEDDLWGKPNEEDKN